MKNKRLIGIIAAMDLQKKDIKMIKLKLIL
ncbi:Uncharacterised protein [Streptococcus pneumoniae]|nr:Uncharacterised protein [Streptococcus pneumoniae]